MSAMNLQGTAYADLPARSGWMPNGQRPGVEINFAGTAGGPYAYGNTTTANAVPSIAVNSTVHTAADTIKLPWKLAANSIFYVYAQLVTAQGATCTVGVATDEASPQTIDSAFNLNGSPGVVVGLNASTPGVPTQWRVGTADCNLIVTLGHTTNVAVVRFYILTWNLTQRVFA